VCQTAQCKIRESKYSITVDMAVKRLTNKHRGTACG